MTDFEIKVYHFFKDFGITRKMVLSTSENDIVTSRMMSIVLIDGVFYFQTDISLKKYAQIKANPNVALCIDNMQIQGVCEEIGRPLDNKEFASTFEKCYKGSFDAFSGIENERLFSVKPVFIERWVYINKKMFIETFDFDDKKYKLTRYFAE